MSEVEDTDADVLLAVFRFANLRPSATQSEAFCETLRASLGACVDGIVAEDASVECDAFRPAQHLDPLQDDRATPLHEFTPRERAWLVRGWHELLVTPSPEIGAVWTLAWFPQYAAVLQAEQLGVDSVALRVLALDNWTLTRHFLASGSCVHSAVPNAHVVLSCGGLLLEWLPRFQSQLTIELTAARQSTGSQRSALSAADKSIGHQKTPQFLVAAVRRALAKVDGSASSLHAPRGGMTDVGQHTGGAPRDTCWPLVCAALRQSLPAHCVTADKVLMRLYRNLLEQKLAIHRAWTPLEVEQFWTHIDTCFEMLETEVALLVRLGEQGYDATQWQLVCQRQRARLEADVLACNKASVKQYDLPRRIATRELPKFKAPDQTLFAHLPKKLRGHDNNQFNAVGRDYEFLDVDTPSISNLLEYLLPVRAQDHRKRLLGLRAVENFLLQMSGCLEPCNAKPVHTTPALLLRLMTWYRDHIMIESSKDDLRRVQRQSMYLLLSWVAFNLAHSYCAASIEELKPFKIVLDWQRLSVCMLDERRARLALQRVAHYIHQWNDTAQDRALFDLTDHTAMLTLARRIGGTRYKNVHDHIQERWLASCETKWQTIVQRKEALRTVRDKLTTDKQNVSRAQARLQTEECRLQREWNARPIQTRYGYYSHMRSTVTQECNSLIGNLTNTIRQLESRRDQLVKMPEFVVSPLPRDTSDGLQVLCMVMPPKDIDQLAELCWRAQHALSTTACAAISKSHPGPTMWSQHVGQYGLVMLPEAAEHAIAFPPPNPVPRSFGPATIDEVWSLESFMASSTWYPVVQGSSVWWCDDEKRWSNPFQIGVSLSQTDFTARIPNSLSGFSWQWAIAHPTAAALDRGNDTYAHWGTSTGAAKEEDSREFCCRGAMRAYPFQQLHNVFANIDADSLAWCDPAVSALVRHALYQVGELLIAPSKATEEYMLTTMRLGWHEDVETVGVAEDLCAMVGRLVGELSHSPRRWRCVPLVSQLAGFLCQFSVHAVALTKTLARMTRGWAEEARASWQGVDMSNNERKELRTRECVLYGYAALCYSHYGLEHHGEDYEGVVELCELLVLFHNAKLSASSDEIVQIQAKIDSMMANRIPRAMAYVQSPTVCSHILTQLCRLVNTSLADDMSWSVVPAADQQLGSCCFTAVDKKTKTEYCVNLFTGAIVANGSLPCELPANIRTLPWYQELFKDRNFEVTCINDVYTAMTHKLQPRRFSFRIDKDTDELLVEEEGPVCTLQLCSVAWRQAFAACFPRRLSDLYSHWHWFDRRAVLLRLREAKDTGVHFVLLQDTGGTSRCFEVPRPDRTLPYDQIVERVSKYPVFVIPDPQIVKVFAKFEDYKFIHTMELATSPPALEIQLPRYGLRFTQDTSGRFVSADHRGFVLSEHQQLAGGQMPRFSQYLVLEHDVPDLHSAKRLLIPCGEVKATGSGFVHIEVSPEVSASIESSAVDEHPRLRTFTPGSIETRLQLAVIYAASGNRLPWSCLGLTGGEAALQMLRGCAPSRPFSTCAKAYLTAVGTQFAFRTPVLALMAALLLEKSNHVAFLFGMSREDEIQVDISDVFDDYRNRVGSDAAALVYPRRQLLTLAEERDLLKSKSAVGTIHAKAYTLRLQCDAVLDGSVVDQDVHTLISETVSEITSSGRSSDAVRLANSATPRVDTTVGRGSTVLSAEATRLPTFFELRQWCSIRETQKPVASAAQMIPPFPLSTSGSNKTSEYMIEELRESWCTFHSHDSRATLHEPCDVLRVRVREKLARVQVKRGEVFALLEQSLARTRSSCCDKLLDTVDRNSKLTLADVMQSVLDDNVLLQLSPRFTTLSRERWKEWSLLLLELCVLEDKLERLLQYDSDAKIMEELQTVKKAWKPIDHPYWLVFEVDGRLEIRQEQFIIAKHLIDNPGSICQLNMGRGKTRVILPMLFLYYSYNSRSSFQSSGQVVRAHFLLSLLSETREFMWRVLTSGVLAMPFIELPFNRSISLGHRELRHMCHVLTDAKRNGAVVVVAPEHRLSLELKRVELRSCGGDTPTLSLLDSLLRSENFVDVFDESDALLNHGYHLVYAVGQAEDLDGGSDRWLAAEALLRVLVNDKSCRVKKVLRLYPDLWSSQHEYGERRGGSSGGGIFNGFRLNAATSDASDGSADSENLARAALREALVKDLIDQAPFDCDWLRFFGSSSPANRDQMVSILTDTSIDLNQTFALLSPVIGLHKHKVLALRGLLAFFVLDNCLEKRYRVEYGHPPCGSRPKAIAIPFQAADLPSERSEFSHPDVGIVLTLLSFYHSGLRDDQLRHSFEVLLGLDEAESERYYGEWFTSIADSLDDRVEREMLASLHHISLDSAHQFAAVCDAYRYSIEVINFYLNFCVFPCDTRQFPSRLSRSAWDLVRGSTNIGFSGTNDTHYLLPLAVKQREPEEPALRGTNGKMIQLLLDATRGYETLLADSDGESGWSMACWQSLLLLALEKKCHALIDTGALLAGVSNDEAAQFLMAQPQFASQGVTYYDTRSEFDGWVVLEKDRNMVQRQKNATLHERVTFVIFDEARARGSDMKLLLRAVALLTLGPKITKDKLMQGAGRLRQLGKDQQTLWITSTPDVFKSMMRRATDTAPVTPVDILNWVVDNTQRQCTLGRLEWAQSGIQYHAKEADAKHEQEDDDWTLEGQYARAQSVKSIAEIIAFKLSAQCEVMVSPQATVETAWNEIRRCGEVFGSQDKVAVSGFGEECERELQIEEEQQEQREITRYEVKACEEMPLAWTHLQSSSSVTQLMSKRIGVEIVGLEHAAGSWLKHRGCDGIVWATAKIFATRNFWSTVRSPKPMGCVSSKRSSFEWRSCLRRVDAMVVFSDESVLLLSEFEADAVLKMLQTARVTGVRSCPVGGSFGFVHLPFATGFLNRLTQASPLSVLVSQIPLALGWSNNQPVVPAALQLPFAAVVVGRLVNGDTDLFVNSHADASESVLRALLQPLRDREEVLQNFISLRGFARRWKRSWLHTITQRMDMEDASV